MELVGLVEDRERCMAFEGAQSRLQVDVVQSAMRGNLVLDPFQLHQVDFCELLEYGEANRGFRQLVEFQGAVQDDPVLEGEAEGFAPVLRDSVHEVAVFCLARVFVSPADVEARLDEALWLDELGRSVEDGDFFDFAGLVVDFFAHVDDQNAVFHRDLQHVFVDCRFTLREIDFLSMI